MPTGPCGGHIASPRPPSSSREPAHDFGPRSTVMGYPCGPELLAYRGGRPVATTGSSCRVLGRSALCRRWLGPLHVHKLLKLQQMIAGTGLAMGGPYEFAALVHQVSGGRPECGDDHGYFRCSQQRGGWT